MRTSGIWLGFFYAPVLCLLWLTKHAVDSVQLSAPAVVTGVYGGSVRVSCQYDQQFSKHTKYWCRGRVYEMCTIVVKTPRNRHSDRHFIADDQRAGVFTVTMTSLRASDDDKYWCVIARRGKNLYTGVRLRLSQTVITSTTSTTSTTISTSSSPPMTQEEIHWWTTLRWILFVLMLCCLVATLIVTWRIKTARNSGCTNNFNIKTQTFMAKFGETILSSHG